MEFNAREKSTMSKKIKPRSLTKINETPVSPIDALVRQLDIIAHEMELKWGQGCLFGFCKPETAAKFIKVKNALDQAIQIGDYDLVAQKVQSLTKGWHLMEQEALEQEAKKKLMEGVSYVVAPHTGIEYIVVKNDLMAGRVMALYPNKASAIFTLDQVAEMIEKNSFLKPELEKEYFNEKIKESKLPKETERLLEDSIPF